MLPVATSWLSLSVVHLRRARMSASKACTTNLEPAKPLSCSQHCLQLQLVHGGGHSCHVHVGAFIGHSLALRCMQAYGFWPELLINADSSYLRVLLLLMTRPG